MLRRLSVHWRLFALTLLAVTVAILWSFDRPVISTTDTIDLWGPVGPTQSQMLLDWYSPSHLVHGFLFFAILWATARRWPVEVRFLVAMAVECGWEIVENTPMVIERYREATAALGYTGDSIVNSVSDVAMMGIAFAFARRLPVWVSVILVLALEIVPLIAIRDNLTLNVWMLLSPDPAILRWQAGA